MAKSTNHTAHNQSYKNHRNGIKKPDQLGKGQRRNMKGVRTRLCPTAHSPWAWAGAPDSPAHGPRMPPCASPTWPPPLPQMDPKFLRNQRFSKKWMGKGRGGDDEE